MTDKDAERFLEELEDCEDDIVAWSERKERENKSFWGFELDPEKEKRLNRLKALGKKLNSMDGRITCDELPFSNGNRHAAVRFRFPASFFTFDKRIINAMAQLYAEADAVTLCSPYCIDEEDGEKIIVMSFDVFDMWQTYGKAPF